MDKFLPLNDAANLYHIPARQLILWTQTGTIRSAMLTTGDVILVNDQDVRALLPKEQQPEYDASLRGHPIGIGEAQRKYGIQAGTLSRWIDRKLIAVLGEKVVRGGRQTLCDEADVAYCVAKYKAAGGHRGSRFFQRSK